MPAPFAQRLEEAQRLHAAGDVAGAVRRFGDLSREQPRNAVVLHALGVALAQAGRLAEAEVGLLRAAEVDPRNTGILFDIGALRDAQGLPGEAEKTMARVVEVDPKHVEAWAALGMYRRDAGDFQGAAQAYRRAYELAPERTDLVLSAAELMPVEEGAELLVDRIARVPNDDSVLIPLAELLMRADRMEEAEATLRTYRMRHPSSGLPGRHLGAVYARLGRLPDAAAALYDSIVREPRNAEAWTVLSKVRDSIGDAEGAAAAAERAIYFQPEDLNLIGLRARLQQHASRIAAAQEGMAALSENVRATSEVRMLQGMLMPPILESNEQIDALRERWMETMEDVAARPTFVPEPWESVAVTGYFLGYHGREDRPLMEALARASVASSPHLEYTASRLGGNGKKIRVGFLSAHMRQHSVGRVLIQLMGALDRERFEVVLFQLPDKHQGGQEFGEAAADRTVRLVRGLEADRAMIEAERLDVLIYCDLHLNSYSDALSYSRLAPVQATTWGHPGTGGHASIDYWISCEDWEPEGAERLYTERLVRLKQAPFVYSPPAAAETPRTRASFGLRDDARLYGCLQSLFKFHPDFDGILAGILERDPKARILLVEGPYYTWQQQLQARFARSFDASRVDYLPILAHKDYLAAIGACDVLLDTIHFGGANTSLDAFSMGKPVVTRPGDQMRNRATAGFYRQIGYERPIAKDDAEYVELALRFAQDRKTAREAAEAIRGGTSAVFDNFAPVADFEAWLEEAVRR